MHWQQVMRFARFTKTEVLVCGTVVAKCCSCAVGPVRLTMAAVQKTRLGNVVPSLSHGFSALCRWWGFCITVSHYPDLQGHEVGRVALDTESIHKILIWHGVTYPRSRETVTKSGGCFKWCVQSALYVFWAPCDIWCSQWLILGGKWTLVRDFFWRRIINSWWMFQNRFGIVGNKANHS